MKNITKTLQLVDTRLRNVGFNERKRDIIITGLLIRVAKRLENKLGDTVKLSQQSELPSVDNMIKEYDKALSSQNKTLSDLISDILQQEAKPFLHH